ncbi:MAG: pentapeptide repeat-containing protein [Thermoleophilia bacterium]
MCLALGHCPLITTDHAYFDHAYLDHAYLDHAYLDHAYFDHAYLDHAYLDQAYFCHCSRTSVGRTVLPLPSFAERS